MKKHHRAGCGSNTNPASLQERFHVGGPAEAGKVPLINPSSAALSMRDALDRFRACMNVAGSVSLLMASTIEHNSKSFGGWEIFGSHPGFVEGTYGIAEVAALRLVSAFGKFEAAYTPMLEAVGRGVRKVASVAVDLDTRDAMLANYKFTMESADGLELERCADVMSDALEMLSITLGSRNAQNGYVGEALAQSARDDLAEALHDVWKAAENLREAAVAVQCHISA